MDGTIIFIIQVLAIVYCITIHEFSHVLAAYLQGDDTGRLMGRLTLNPLAHLDPIGTVLLFIVGFGWGKPAPFNPYNLRNQKWGELIVSAAGILSNLASIFVFVLLLAILLPHLGNNNLFIVFLLFLIFYNALLMLFNLLPIPPLDGSKIFFEFLPSKFQHIKDGFSRNGPWILLGLIIADKFLGIHIFDALFGWLRGSIFIDLPMYFL